MQTEKSFYKTYSLDSNLPLYLNFDGFLVKEIEPEENDLEDSNSEESNPAKEMDTNADDIEIDGQLEKDFWDDVDLPENETAESKIQRIKRYQRIVNKLKEKYGYKCQICGESFLMDNGKHYCEAHHIKMLSKGGSQGPENIIIICANHHRMFHYATNSILIGELIDSKREIRIGTETYIVYFVGCGDKCVVW